MRKSILAALLLMVAGLQTAWGQGFRVYKSDGTVAQFSMRADSIVFYDDLGSDQDFGPYTPVNQCIAGTWWISRTESVTFNEDGTTDYMEGATYEFFPYQGYIIIYNASGAPQKRFFVYKLTDEKMIINYQSDLDELSRTKPVQLVTEIALNKTSLYLKPGQTQAITVFIAPYDADNVKVTWESSNEAVAQVTNGLVEAVGKGLCVITCRTTDGSNLTAECMVSVNTDTKEYVDLGLPSGTLWATCNIGASAPEEFGDYFAWGELQTKSRYTWGTYKWMNEGQSSGLQINKYTFADGKTDACWYSDGVFVGDGLTVLLPEDDAATANWGTEWQMPTVEQLDELIGNSSSTRVARTLQNGVYGIKIMSTSNGNSIFLPAAGNKDGVTFYDPRSNDNARSFYMTRTLSSKSSDAFNALNIDRYDYNKQNLYRYYGLSIRPVRKR